MDMVITAAVMMIDPAAIILCVGFSMLIGDFRFALPVGAVIQSVLMFGVGEFPPIATTIVAAVVSGVALAAIGVTIRQGIIEPRRAKR